MYVSTFNINLKINFRFYFILYLKKKLLIHFNKCLFSNFLIKRKKRNLSKTYYPLKICFNLNNQYHFNKSLQKLSKIFFVHLSSLYLLRHLKKTKIIKIYSKKKWNEKLLRITENIEYMNFNKLKISRFLN